MLSSYIIVNKTHLLMEYSRDHVHAIEGLVAFTPNDVLRYVNLKTFGTTEPAGEAKPTSAHANTLPMDKKQFRISSQIAIGGV